MTDCRHFDCASIRPLRYLAAILLSFFLCVGISHAEGEGTEEGFTEGILEGALEGDSEGNPEGMQEGEGGAEGSTEGGIEGTVEGTLEGESEGGAEGSAEGEGAVEGVVEGDIEGMVEGEPEAENVEHPWLVTVGGTGADVATAVAQDSSGATIFVGYFSGTMDFDPGEGEYSLTSHGGQDAFVVKLNPDRTLAWARNMGGGGTDSAEDVVVDDSGNVYVFGNYQGVIDLAEELDTEELTSLANGDVYVMKLDGDGNFEWGLSTVSINLVRAGGIALSPDASIVCSGDFNANTDFNPGLGTKLLSTAGDADIFVWKLSETGGLVWAKSMGGTGTDRGRDVGVDPEGNVFTCGSYAPPADLDPGEGVTELAATYSHVFVSKLNPTGLHVWVRGLERYGSLEGIVADSDGSVVTLGNSVIDTYVSKFDGSGNLVWLEDFSKTDTFDLCLDSSGNSYATGRFQNQISIDSDGDYYYRASTGSYDAYAMMLDSTGRMSWVRQLGGSGADSGRGIAVTPDGGVLVAGDFSDTAEFDNCDSVIEVLSAGSTDAYVAELPSTLTSSYPSVISITPSITGLTSATSISFSVTLDQEVKNLDRSTDFLVEHEGVGIYRRTVTGSGKDYTLTLDGLYGVGTVRVTASREGDVQNACGVRVGASVTSEAVQIDTVQPIVILTTPAPYRIPMVPFAVYVEFDEDVSELSVDDIRVFGGTVTSFSGSGRNYVLEVTPRIPGLGVIDVSYGAVIDPAGNLSNSSNSLIRQFVSPGASGGGIDSGAWARRVGGRGSDAGAALAMDSAGNVFVTGSFADSVDFDPGIGETELTAGSDADVFVAKYAVNSSLEWVSQISGTGSQETTDLAIDSAGNVLVSGEFKGTVDFDPGIGVNEISAPTSHRSGFILKLNASGDLAWVRTFVSTSEVKCEAIAVDEAGNICIVGAFFSPTDFDPGPNIFELSASSNYFRAYVLKLNDDGDFVWVKAFTGNGWAHAYSVTTDSDGNIYTTGSFAAMLDLDPGLGSDTVVSGNGSSTFVAKLNASGGFSWGGNNKGTMNFPGYEGDAGLGIHVDHHGNIYTVGRFRGTVDFDPSSASFELSSGEESAHGFIQKLDPSGALLWVQSLGSYSTDKAIALGFDGVADPHVVWSGYEPNSVRKFSAAGELIWSRYYDATIADVAVGADGYFALTGHFTNDTDFGLCEGGQFLSAWSLQDVFLARFHEVEDLTGPSAITITPGTQGPTNLSRVDFEVEFDEAIRFFDDGLDVVIEHDGTLSWTRQQYWGISSVYTVSVSGLSGEGSFTLSVNTESDVEDDCGNALVSSVVSVPVFIDRVAPQTTLSVDGASKATGVITFQVAFTEAVTGLEAEDFTVINGTAALLNGNGDAYSLKVVPSQSGEVKVRLLAGQAFDSVGNGNLLSNEVVVPVIVEGEPGEGADGEGIGNEGGFDGEGNGLEGEHNPEDAHTADLNRNFRIGISELLRVIQLYNAGSFQCAPGQSPTEDGFVPAQGPNHACAPHDGDYQPKDWSISLGEALRIVQFFNLGGYDPCEDGEDGYCAVAR